MRNTFSFCNVRPLMSSAPAWFACEFWTILVLCDTSEMSVCFFFLSNSQAHYLDKIVKGTVYLLFDNMPIPTCIF